MADLEPLIRFRKHTVDEKRKVLAQLLREVEVVEMQKKVILDQMAREIGMAKELERLDADAYLGKYLQGARRKVRALELSIKKMEVRIQAAQDDIRDSFAEMKKIEITQENREKRDEAAQKRKEDNELDDIAIDRFRRNQDDN